ncbi:hypothetical protein [Erwinia sp. ErVv1]|uniref:hypothetical protein n=1 Tax=Erwinia sp. ErVv1 TaxID=1603299 RepID=UPI000AFBF430|nr:hypothetical protein [Erwinia sp. ErVv1]
MPVSAVNQNTSPTLNEVSTSIYNLRTEQKKITRKISEIKNTQATLARTIDPCEKTISSNDLSLIELNKVADKYGKDARVRLKEDHFKYGEPRNLLKKLFHGYRYKIECRDAVKKIKRRTNKLSAEIAIKTIEKEKNNEMSKRDELKKDYNINALKIKELTEKEKHISLELDEIRETYIELTKEKREGDMKRENFSMIYNSNAGCKAINHEARHQYGLMREGGKLDGNKVVDEYCRAHGDNIFNRGGAKYKDIIKTECYNLKNLVENAINDFYTPSNKMSTTYRGQRMTNESINTLISQYNTDMKHKDYTVYQTGQFFSTSSVKTIANGFANRSQSSDKVMFTVKGNSGNDICSKWHGIWSR